MHFLRGTDDWEDILCPPQGGHIEKICGLNLAIRPMSYHPLLLFLLDFLPDVIGNHLVRDVRNLDVLEEVLCVLAQVREGQICYLRAENFCASLAGISFLGVHFFVFPATNNPRHLALKVKNQGQVMFQTHLYHLFALGSLLPSPFIQVWLVEVF